MKREKKGKDSAEVPNLIAIIEIETSPRGTGLMRLTLRAFILMTFLFSAAPAFAQDGVQRAPTHLTLQVTTDIPGERCRRIETFDPASLALVSLHRTFHDDFDEHPLSSGRWVSHYAGGAAWPEARYWGGDGSDRKRKSAQNGEQQIYVDTRYGGRATAPLGLDPFKIRDGVLDRRKPNTS
jgi:hypothetical protein